MSEQRRPGKYPDELRERAVRMVFEVQRDCGSQWEAISSVAHNLGPTPETVRKWVRRTEIDAGRRPGLTSDKRERLKRFERENQELRRANEILNPRSSQVTGLVRPAHSRPLARSGRDSVGFAYHPAVEASDLIELCPHLYHVTACDNWESILQHGLLPVSALLERFEDDDGERGRRERRHRSGSETLEHPEHGRAILRDQKPLNESMLRHCLLDDLMPEDWYQILNQRVFFWPNCDRVKTFLRTPYYRSMRHLLIVVRTDRLLADCSDRIELSPINSGATRSVEHKRGRGTFAQP